MKKILPLVFTITVFSFGAFAQNVNIPDANFKAYLLGNAAINDDGDPTEISVSEAAAFTGEINCSSMSISDITGIEAFTSLTSLKCNVNSITSLDLSQNTALTALQCNANQFSTLDLSQNINLTSVLCSFQPNLGSINIGQNSALTQLYCFDNQLTVLDLNNTPSLTQLRCNNNQLTTLNVANGNNSNMADADFHAENNPLLSCIQVDNSTYSTDNWTNIDAGTSFSNTSCPCNINVSIPDANFKAYLVNNASINTNSNSEIECSEAAAFSGQINCHSLNITDFTGLEAFTALTEFRCTANGLTSLDVTSNTALTDLNCGYNNLSSLDISNNTALTDLDCSENQLADLDLSNNAALSELECGSNNLTALDVSNNTDLFYLYCSDNQLTTLDVVANTTLYELRCEDNLLTSLDFSLNTVLEYLTCDNNQLTMLNVANGNNITQFVFHFSSTGNPNLTCIQVDDASYSTDNWTSIDSQSYFSEAPCLILVNSIAVQGQGGVSTINVLNGTLQMEATVLPLDASDNTYAWSITNGTGTASINNNGLVTAISDGTVTVTATANDGSGTTGSSIITISNQSSLGVSNQAGKNVVSVYPNPVKSQLVVNTEENIKSIVIVDIMGKSTTASLSTKSTIDFSDFTNGVYFLQVKTDNALITKKIIKQ